MKSPNLFFRSLLFLAVMSVDAQPVFLRCESLANPLGIDTAQPALSWKSNAHERNWRQTAYQILVATKPDLLKPGAADVWDSKEQISGESVGIAYGGPALESRRRYYWAVRVRGGSGHLSQSDEAAWWEMGLLRPTDWSAKWIRWQNPEDAADLADIRWIWVPGHDALKVVPGTQALFHLDFSLTSPPDRASLFLIARGDWKVTVNGHDAGAKPHWNEFDRRELGPFLKLGKNSIEVTVTAAQSEQWGPNAAPPGTPQRAALAALVKIWNNNGKVERIGSAERWQARLENDTAFATAAVVGELSSSAFGDPGPLPQPAALLRREFAVSKRIQKARLYVTALGAYEMFLNGQRVGRDLLTPGFTQFENRLQYQTYDVTAMLTGGRNIAAAVVGAGWFGSAVAWTAEHFKVTGGTRFLAQFEIECEDGSRQVVETDDQWKAAESPILHAEIYAGEIYDARLEQPGWNAARFDDTSWAPALMADPYAGKLSSQIDPPPRVVATIKPEKVTALPDGSSVFDMGQNMVGWVALRVKGDRGRNVRLRFAEILNSDGTIYTTNLRNADATDSYTLRGSGEEVFAPRFTFHGFRYVEVSGYPGGQPKLADITGEVVSSLGGDPTATIETSSDLVNKMWRLGIWGQRGNFLSVPTDCPQRDERLGWMADAAVFWRTGSYNFDIAAFTNKWLRDVTDAQLADGAFTNVSPNIGLGDIDGAPGWGDAGVIVPWTTWLQYGNRAVIDRNWDAMQRWMRFIAEANPDFIRRNKVGPDFSDWLAPDPSTPKDLVDTAYWALIAEMMRDMAHATGREDDARTYSQLQASLRGAFQRVFVKPDSTVGSGSQTSYVLALQMKLLPPEMEPIAVDKLVKNIEAHDWHLTTGFLGTPYLLFVLGNHGRIDVAYRLLLNETYPSWGYMIKKGATTWWERWNGDTGDPAMNSYNHYAFGSVVSWVYQNVAGIDTVSSGPGFHEITIHPRLVPQLPTARGEYESVYGRISTESNLSSNGRFTLRVSIPPNTTAKVMLPKRGGGEVRMDGKAAESEAEGDSLTVHIGSGSYDFEVR
jgi:alpha-L-rhamnosidase